MKNYFIVLVFVFFGCKSLRYNDASIHYYLDEKGLKSTPIGDFQEVQITKNMFVRVMPSYFRSFESLTNSLVVRINLDKKFGLSNSVVVKSSQFGELKKATHEWLKINYAYDDLFFVKDVSNLNNVERKHRILKDTLSIQINDFRLKFVPNTK